MTRLVLLCCTALLLSGCSLGLGELPIGRSADGNDYLVTAEFPRADRIRLGTEVRVGQHLVGRVHDLTTDGRGAQVGLSLEASTPLPADVTASLELPSALGEPYVRLEVPADPSSTILVDGDVIENTGIGPELENSLATLGLVLNGSGIDQLQGIVTEMNDAFGGRGPEIRELMHSADALLAKADAQQAEFDRVLIAAGAVSAALADNRATLDAGLAVAAPTMDLLVRQRDRISSLITTTSSLAENARELLGDNTDRLASGVDDLAVLLASIQGFNDSVTPTLDNMNQFIEGFDGAVHGDYLVFDGALDLPETVGELMTGGRVADVPATLEQLLVPEGPR
ncbi:MCE family protein [Rhodococcus sp. BP-252]|uniref:MCE family protein n=1 Tax=unclassified Rhodococcus (in: high G+C Gram-positive bacteria) TaxID=192944 RepID=UPI001C9BAF6B|nr:MULTISPECIES: MCE family protein [unclassified Rhodococcus (in: high G+C Gram-positive bacteria)]MBY6410793.1 MCE family protein [Rhodococcus sp. BP-320]MBY6415382.1 MCE family protein [Rhodococcus sp. BP-321]MBY6419997.1 MCE family protein [Rhodococcus sp. BP-324]MBY6425349.1 MCE family protein [Rhodococcus sp. BP-323]MBY6430588.1 MCE family protein [Rhodococcus sp. BP-322]